MLFAYLGHFLEHQQLFSICSLEQDCAAKGPGTPLEIHEGAGAPAVVLEGAA